MARGPVIKAQGPVNDMARGPVNGARASQWHEGQSLRRKGQSMARGPVIKAQGPVIKAQGPVIKAQGPANGAKDQRRKQCNHKHRPYAAK